MEFRGIFDRISEGIPKATVGVIYRENPLANCQKKLSEKYIEIFEHEKLAMAKNLITKN